MKNSAADAVAVRKSAEVMRLHIRIKKQSLIMINVKAAAVVSEPAVLMQYTIQTAVQMNFLTVRWPNMHRQSVMDVRISM